MLRIVDLDAPKQRDLLYLFNHCGFQIAASLVQPEENEKLKLFPDHRKEGGKKQCLYYKITYYMS